MSWLFSRALVEEYWPASCSDGEQCARLNVMPTPHKFWRNDKTTEHLKLSRFGLTLKVLTADHGEELLTSYLAAFRVKTYQSPDVAKVLRAKGAGSGRRWRASFAQFNQNGFLWKTPQLSLFEGSIQCLATWPQSGLMLRGECYQLATLALGTNAREFGLLPTVTSAAAIQGQTSYDGKRGQTLIGAVRGQRWRLPTIVASNATSVGNIEKILRLPTVLSRSYRAPGKTRRGKDNLESRIGGKLNPPWIEWLMGFPVGWTELKPLEMHKFQSWQQAHSFN